MINDQQFGMGAENASPLSCDWRVKQRFRHARVAVLAHKLDGVEAKVAVSVDFIVGPASAEGVPQCVNVCVDAQDGGFGQ